jgi:hypothetical protein
MPCVDWPARSGIAMGVDLAVSGCVQLVSFAPVRVTARVEDLVFHHVELRSTGTGLSWSCTCREGASQAAQHITAEP